MITGKVTSIYGKDINTDDIIPASFLQQSTDRKFFKDYAFDRYDPAFRERCKQSINDLDEIQTSRSTTPRCHFGLPAHRWRLERRGHTRSHPEHGR